jgi:hypothetical protein
MRRGFANVLQPSLVATGTPWIYTIPAEYWTRLVSIIAPIATGAPSGDRIPFMAYNQGDGTSFAEVPIGEAIGGSVSVQCCAAIDGPALTVVSGKTLNAEGRQLGPGALTTICSAALAGGEWIVNWEVQLDGTTAAAEQNNFGLYNGGTLLATANNPSNVGGPYPQEPVVIAVGSGGGTLAIKNIAAATATAGYTGSFSAEPYGGTVAYAKLPDIIMQPGWQLEVGLTNIQSTDVIQNVVMLVEQYPSDWASGTEDREVEDILRELFERAYSG